MDMNETSEVLEFGIKREDEILTSGGCAIIFDPKTHKYAVGKEEGGKLRLFSGGLKEGENVKEGILREVLEESGLHDFEYVEKIAEAVVHYYNSLKKQNRGGHTTCLLVILKSTDIVPTQLEAHEKFKLEWVSTEEMLENWKSINQNHDYDHWIYFLNKSVERATKLGYVKM